MFKKVMVCFMVLCLMVGGLTGCSNGKNEKKETQVNNQQTQEAKVKEADTGESDKAERYIDDGGILWDTETNMYVIEEEILNGSAEMKLWVDNEKFGDVIKERFLERYPNVQLVVEVVASTDSITKMSLEGEAGTGADVFIIPHDGVGDAMNSAVIGMMGRYSDIIRDRFLDSAVATVDIDGQVYGVPFLTESIALIYNKTLLSKLESEGIAGSAEPAKDMSEIKLLADKYNNIVDNRWTIRWEAGNSYINYMFLTANGYQLFGEDGSNPDLVNLDTNEVVNGLSYYQSFRPVWNVNSGDTTWDTTVIEFAKGDTPYLISGPWCLETVYEGATEHGFEVGVSPLPLFDGKQPYTFSGVQLACVSSYSKYPAASRALAMCVGSDEVLTFAYQVLKKLPAVKDGSNIPGLQEDLNVQAFMNQAQFSNAMPSITEISFYWTATEGMFRAVWDGTVSPVDASKQAQKDFEALRVSGQ